MEIRTLSPSMVVSYINCSRRFYYENCLRLPRLPNHYLAFGSAFHETLRENYWQKVQTQKDLNINVLTDFFCEDLEYRDVDWSGDVDLSQAKDEGVVSVRSYQEGVAQWVQPARVEYAFTMEVTGREWAITGKVDLIDTDNLVMETKTTWRNLSKPKKEHVFQTGVYSTAVRKQANLDVINARIDYTVVGKDLNHSYPLEFDGAMEENVLAMFDQVAKGIQNEIWIPNRFSNYCSRKYCAYFRSCEADCGGRVPD